MVKEVDDFGFSLVDEDELRSAEKELADKVDTVTITAKNTKQRLEEVMHLMNDFLNKLSADPSKTYILWPDRAAKIKNFKEKLNKIANV